MKKHCNEETLCNVSADEIEMEATINFISTYVVDVDESDAFIWRGAPDPDFENF